MNSFEEGFMAGFLMNYRKKETEKEDEKWQHPSDWLPLPNVGVNEAAFLIFSEKDSSKNHSFSINAYSVEDSIAGVTNNNFIDYIDMGNGITYSGLTANEKCNVLVGISYDIGRGTPLTDNVEMYILRIHFTRPNIFQCITPSNTNNNGVYIIAYNIDCGVIAGTYINSNGVETSYSNGILSQPSGDPTVNNKFLMYARISGNSKNFDIRKNFFNRCFSLQRVDFETPPTTINQYTFTCCYCINDANLPDLTKVTTLGMYAFNYCNRIKKLNLPSVTTVPNNCFAYMPYLQEISLKNATSIGSSNFQNFYNLSKITIPKVTSISKSCFTNTKITKLDLPGFTSISSSRFSGMYYLQELNIENVTSIGYSNFQNFYSLSKINAPKLTSVDTSCFTNTNITNLDLPALNNIGTGSFNNNYNLTTVNLPSLKTLGDCFTNNYNLTTINSPSLETSGNSFTNCYSLRSIDLSSLTALNTDNKIGAGCYALQHVTAPNIDLTRDTVFPDSYMIK